VSVVESAESQAPVGDLVAASTAYRAKSRVIYLAFLAAFTLAFLLSASLGPVAVPPLDVLRVLAGHLLPLHVSTSPIDDTIVWDIRLPRVILAALVGGTLAYSGAVYQSVFRNPLADPYLLGVASGAALAATIVVVGPLPATFHGLSLITAAAFVGALAAVLITYALARGNSGTSTTALILAGVAVSSLTVSLTSYLMLVEQRDSLSILSWLLGGFSNSSWDKLLYIVPYALPAAAVVLVYRRVLNVLFLGDEDARYLGVNVETTRLVLLIAASLAAASAVAVAGIIGFIGLVAPHAVRLIAGPDYRRLLPLSALLGASFLMLADLAARTAVSPGELPVGVITGCLGAPFFLFLLRRSRSTLS
jgi:iron complex transport system permease protein